MKTKKHNHNWQFSEKIPAHPMWKIIDVKEVWNMERECIGWSKSMLEFVCECGERKLVNFPPETRGSKKI